MKMRQREILNKLSLDFARDGESQEVYVAKKMEQIKEATKEYAARYNVRGFVLGLSGGIDSFVTAALTADAILGLCSLHLLILPCGEQKDIADAIECATVLTNRFENVTYEIMSILPAYEGVSSVMADSMFEEDFDAAARGNVQARLRMVHQYALAKGRLVLGTDHATENIIGYYTKYGDGGTDFNPMDGLIKPDIYQIASYYGAPRSVMEKKPAAGLGISETDEAEIGMTYDAIARYLTGNLLEKEEMLKLVGMYDASEHKRHTPASPLQTWWKYKKEDTTHIVVDMIGAFIDGSMACENATPAVANVVDFINDNAEMRVLYVRDYHPEGHVSFEEEGGQWPAHAMQGSEEIEFPAAFYTDIEKTINTPIVRYNVFNKGAERQKEEYSAFNAVNDAYGALKFNLTRKIVVSGIATEFCVKSTVEDLLKNGFEVQILSDALGFIDFENHKKVLVELADMGAHII